MKDADPFSPEQRALRHLECIAFQLAHVRLMLSHGCYGAQVTTELGRLRDQINDALTVLDLVKSERTAVSPYYTVRQHRLGEDAHIKIFKMSAVVPDVVPAAWYAEWLRSTP
jgi:hypothetical protein